MLLWWLLRIAFAELSFRSTQECAESCETKKTLLWVRPNAGYVGRRKEKLALDRHHPFLLFALLHSIVPELFKSVLNTQRKVGEFPRQIKDLRKRRPLFNVGKSHHLLIRFKRATPHERIEESHSHSIYTSWPSTAPTLPCHLLLSSVVGISLSKCCRKGIVLHLKNIVVYCLVS